MPPVLPMELFRVSQCDVITMVRNHKKKLVNHFQEKANNVIESICDQYWEMRARSKEINVKVLHNTQGLHTIEREGELFPLCLYLYV